MSSYNHDYLSYPALIWAQAALAGAGGKGKGMTPYEYAVSIGFIGTKDEFDIKFLAALGGGPTRTIFDGGICMEGGDSVGISGGISDSRVEEFITDASMDPSIYDI